MLICNITLQTVKGGISETRIEKRIVITGDTEIDHDKVEVDLVDLVGLADVLVVPCVAPPSFCPPSPPPGSGSGHQGGQRAASRHVSDQSGGAPGNGDHSRVTG